jgi:hypothetical protein
MRRLLIQSANFALLAILLIGIPAVAHAQFGGWQISPASRLQTLIFWGLIIAASANVAASFVPFVGGKQRRLCWEWAVVFGGLLGVQYAYTHGHLNFDWLKQALQWAQNHL